MHTPEEFIAIVQKTLDAVAYPPAPAELYNPIRYELALGGKRIRPVLTLLSCELFDGDYREALDAAAGIEIFHNFTLLHDDVMDKADLRRGKPTVHVKWDENTETGQTLIYATIYVSRPMHKAMVIGKQGAMIKKIGTEARQDIQQLLDGKVHLELWVKVREHWSEDLNFIGEVELENLGIPLDGSDGNDGYDLRS